MFVPVRISSPSLADLIRPYPLASTRHTKGRNSGNLSCSSISALSSALNSGLLPPCSLASRPHGDWEWYSQYRGCSALAKAQYKVPLLDIGGPVVTLFAFGIESIMPPLKEGNLALKAAFPEVPTDGLVTARLGK
jgi:hypothetical protein